MPSLAIPSLAIPSLTMPSLAMPKIAPLALLAALGFALAVPAQAGEITRDNAQSDFQWRTTTCVRPQAPAVTGSGGAASDAIANYSIAVERYVACLQRESQADFDRAQQRMYEAVQAGVTREVDRVRQDVDRFNATRVRDYNQRNNRR